MTKTNLIEICRCCSEACLFAWQGEGYDARSYYNNTVIVMGEFAWGILEMGDRAYDVSCRFGGTQVETLEFNMQVP